MPQQIETGSNKRLSLTLPAPLFHDDRQLHIATLALLLAEILGPKWFDMEAEDYRWRLEEGHGYGPIGPYTWDRINAADLLLSNNMAWEEWELFELVAAAASGESVNFTHVQPQDPPDLALGIMEMQRMAPYEFSQEVKKYIAASCLWVGVWFLPKPLDIAQDAVRAYDREHNIERDYDAVAAALKANSWKSASTQAEVQAEKVAIVTEMCNKYEKSVAAQIRQIPQFKEMR